MFFFPGGRCTEPPDNWAMVTWQSLILPVFTTVCAERKRCFIRIDGPDASMPGGDLHPFVPQHCVPSPKVTASHLCSSCSLCLLLPSCSTGRQSREHCMRLLILRKQTCLAGPLRCKRTWKMLLKTQSLLLGFKALLCLLSSLPRLLGTEKAATPRTTAVQGGDHRSQSILHRSLVQGAMVSEPGEGLGALIPILTTSRKMSIGTLLLLSHH